MSLTLTKEEFARRLQEVHDAHDDGASFDALQTLREDAIASENLYRELFARQRDSWEIPEIDDPYLFLLDVFDHSSLMIKVPTSEDSIPRCCPLSEQQRWTPGSPTTVPSMEEFNISWECFSEGLLRFLDWNNVFAAGGSVAGCLAPLPKEIATASFAATRVQRRKYFHDTFLPSSDIDLFLYGLTEDQAAAKLLEIFDAVQAASPYEIRAFRTAHAISLVSRYPFRHVQIVLRLYNSPSEILMGFDVDACAAGFNGSKVYVCPRTALAIVTQTNTVDMSRRSPSYEIRLAKYAERGYEVMVPSLDRDRVDPFLYEKRFDQVKGLSRLLLLERLKTPEQRLRYRLRSQLKNANEWTIQRRIHKAAGDSRNIARMEGGEGIIPDVTGPEVSDYSTLFLPWGPNWPADKLERLTKKKDRLINKLEFLPNGQVIKSRRPYKIHVCAVGTMEEVINNPFPNDPIPEDVPPESLETSVRGKVTWLVDNPGRQRIGSFHPITSDDWHEGAYISSQTEELIAAANANDPERVQAALNDGAQLSARDFLGRTALHVAVVSGANAVCRVLLGHPDANMSFLKAKLPDGRNVLHIASMRQEVELLDMILVKRKELFVALQEEGTESPSLAEILDIDGSDWEVKLNPLHYAILLGNFDAAKCLIQYGADVQKVAVQKDANESFSCFGLIALFSSECGNMLKLEEMEKMIRLLVEKGASPAQIDTNGSTAWHRFASSFKSSSLEVLKVALNSQPKENGKPKGLDIMDNSMQTPLSVAARCGNAPVVSFFLEAGATPSFDGETWEALMQRKMEQLPRYRYGYHESDIQACARIPFFLAVRCLSPSTVSAFLSRHPSLANAEIQMPKLSFQRSLGGCEVEGDNELTLRPLDYLNALEISLDNEGRRRSRHNTNRGSAVQKVKCLLQQAEGLAGNPNLSSYRHWALKLVMNQLESRAKATESRFTPDPSPEELKEKADREERTNECIQILKNHGGKALLRFKEPQKESQSSQSFTSDGTKLMEPWQLMNNCSPSPSQYLRVHLHGKQAVLSSQRDSYRRMFEQIVDGRDSSEIMSLAETMKVSVFDSLGNTVFSLAILHNRPTLFQSLARLATSQFISHLEHERGIQLSEDDIRKSELKEADNLLKDQLRRLNNLDIAAGTEPTGANLMPTPDLMRQRLDLANAEACLQGSQPDGACIKSSVSLDHLLTFRSIVSLEQLPRLESVLKANAWSPNQDMTKQRGQPVRVNVFETAALSGDVALFRMLQNTAFQYCKIPSAQTAYENEEACDPAHSDEDDDYSSDADSPSQKNGLAADCRRTVSELREAVYGSGNPDLGGMTLIEMVIALDDLPMLRALIPLAREFLIPRAAVVAWKTSCDAAENLAYLWSRPQPTLIQLALSFKARTIVDAFFQSNFATELYKWIMDEPDTRKLRSKLRNKNVTSAALLGSASLCLQWILTKRAETSFAEICDRLCGVRAPDAVGRTALYYAQASEIPDTLTAATTSPDGLRFVDCIATDGSISALVAAACGAQFDRLEKIIEGGADLSLCVGPKQWNVLHHIISVRPQTPRKSADKKEAENIDPWGTSRMLINTVLRAADENVTEACLLPTKAEHTPLMLAIQRGADTETLSFLLEKYGRLAGRAIEKLDNELNTVLHYAVKNDLAHTETGSVKTLSSVKTLIKHDKMSCTTQANAENARGLTPEELALDSVATPWIRGRSNRIDRFSGRPGQTRAHKVSNDPLDNRVLLGALAQMGSPRAAASFQDVKTAKDVAAKALKEMENAARTGGGNWAHEKAYPRITSPLGLTGEWNGWYYRYN